MPLRAAVLRKLRLVQAFLLVFDFAFDAMRNLSVKTSCEDCDWRLGLGKCELVVLNWLCILPWLLASFRHGGKRGSAIPYLCAASGTSLRDIEKISHREWWGSARCCDED